MNAYQQQLQIDAYLRGTLAREEERLFADRLAQDPGLQAALEVTQTAHQLVEKHAVLMLKQKLQGIHETSEQQRQQRKKRWWWFGLGTFALMALVGALLWNFQTGDPSVAEATPIKTASNSVTETEAQTEATFSPSKTTAEGQPTTPVETGTQESDLIPTDIESSKNDSLPENRLGAILDGSDTSQTPSSLPPNLDITDWDKEKTPPDTSLQVKQMPKVDPCASIQQQTAKHLYDPPCLEEKSGMLEVSSGTSDFTGTAFSIDGGENFQESPRFVNVTPGSYQLVVATQDGCFTQPRAIVLPYADCHYTLQPDQQVYWEIEIPEITAYPLTLEIRHARTGRLVELKTFYARESYRWEGNDSNGNAQGMGAYFYIWRLPDNQVLAKGQLTILR
ncbi:MAG: hypothetical protein ACFB10_23020 [Salibacteraceae bacterium]